MYHRSPCRPLGLLSLTAPMAVLVVSTAAPVLPAEPHPALTSQGGPVRPLASCAATPLRHTSFPGLNIPWIKAAPSSAGIAGHLFFVYPGARGGDADLHTGGVMPNGGSTKILSLIAHGDTTVTLVIDGRNLTGAGRTHQVFPRAAGVGGIVGVQYPSIVVVPTPGCWRFLLHSGAAAGTVTLPVIDSGAPWWGGDRNARIFEVEGGPARVDALAL